MHALPRALLAFTVAALGCQTTLAESHSTVKSPNGRVAVSVASGRDGLSYSVTLDGEIVIADSPLGLMIDGVPWGSSAMRLADQSSETVKELYRPVAGKTARVDDHYSRLSLQFVGEEENQAKRLNLRVRAYDNGVAFRYRLPEQPGLAEFTIQNELTSFAFPKDYTCYGLNLGKFHNSHEGEFDPIKASRIRTHHLYDNPLVCKTGHGQTTFALAEADVRDYAGAWMTGRGDSGLGVSIQLTPRFDNRKDGLDPAAVKARMPDGGFETPWRVIMLGDSPGALTESALVETLGEPTHLPDTDWIKPGKVAWDWWNDNQVVLDEAARKAGIEPGMNTATYKAYIDFAATLGLEYILIDSGWHVGASWSASPGSDVVQPIPEMDMSEILRYARERDVGVWVWVQWKQLDWQMEEALSTYEKWGIKGIKVDFMDRNDQEMVEYYHKLLSMTGRYHIMVNLHGAYAPNGLTRTYPHYLTQEGVMGAEYNKWSRRVTATHNVTIPFTRMILGPIDYTPGGFRHTTPEQFPDVRRNTLPYVKTTRGQALAMFVVYDSPLQMLADSPITYSKTDGDWPQPESEWEEGLTFIRDVPVTWDETRVLEGEIGEYIVTARRKGKDWYVGAMTNEQGRTLELPLGFLSDQRFSATIWQDGNSVSSLIKTHKERVNIDGTLRLELAPSGGAVVHLRAR